MQYQPALHFSSGAHPAETRKLPLCSVLGLPLVSADVETVIRTLLAPGRRTVFFLNAHCANIRAGNASYAAALARADYVLPDGIGVELAARDRAHGVAVQSEVARYACAWCSTSSTSSDCSCARVQLSTPVPTHKKTKR